ncbi:hypothetical protein ACFYVR_22750 [Rhodococcus sp. NPDC003318]|uniref:hypothetical protein n=1 Tax=Rhodococcus sp. NPDC003318 TaxID=3364503 RepID=UPI0036D17CEF
MPSTTLKRIVGGAAIAAAGVGVTTALHPATASAQTTVTPPTVVASSAGTSVSLEVTNPNEVLSLSGCQAFVVNAVDALAVLADPATILEPGVLVYPTVTDPLTLFGVLPGQTVKSTVEDVPAGVYAVIGGCATVADPANPVLGTPQLLGVGLIPGDTGSAAVELPFEI